MFDSVFDVVAGVLAWFYALPAIGGSYGLAIMLLTMAVMILLTPLTLRATRSTIKMQQVQPELKRIQKEHKGDRETLNAELMKLYQEHGINPVGGCIPMLAQLPVFLVLFRVLQGLSRRLDSKPFFDVANQARTRGGLEPLTGETFWPQYISPETDMYQDLSVETEMAFGPLDLAERALDVLQDDFLKAIPYILLILFVVGSSYFQQRQVSARRGSDDVSPINAQQQALLRLLPLMSGIWSFLFPAGLVLYWATSNVFRIGQQAYITHQIYGREGAAETLAEVRRRSAEVDKEPSGKKKSGAGDKKPDDKKKPSKASSDTAPSDTAPSDTAPSDAAPSTGKAQKNPRPPGDREAALKASGGDGSTNGASDREAAWQRRRQQKAKAKPRSAGSSGSGGSSRVTPKGTTPNRSKKKRKR